jgi:hypothetical protein
LRERFSKDNSASVDWLKKKFLVFSDLSPQTVVSPIPDLESFASPTTIPSHQDNALNSSLSLSSSSTQLTADYYSYYLMSLFHERERQHGDEATGNNSKL